MTTTEAAAALGIDPATVRQAIRTGRLAATRFGRDWQIDPAEVERYRQSRRAAPRRATEGED
jgi:excisionase family DNA binding protein